MEINVEWDGNKWILRIPTIGLYAACLDVDVMTELLQSIIKNITVY